MSRKYVSVKKTHPQVPWSRCKLNGRREITFLSFEVKIFPSMTSGESFKSDNRRDKRWKQRETKRRARKKYSSIQREIEEIGYVPATFVNYGVTKLASGKSVVGRMPKEIKPPRWKKRKNGKEEKLISSWFDLS